MTLGVLLVHGIGTQRRGDTLLQAGDALHHWLRRWLKQDVELVDTDLAPFASDSSTPAHSRLLFRDGTKVSSTNWLLAECHWATAFRPPTYRGLLRWAWLIVPRAVLLHLVPRFRQAFELGQAIDEDAKTRWISAKTMRLFERYVGRPPRRIDDRVDPWDLVLIKLLTLVNVFSLILLAMCLAMAGLASLIALSVLLVVSLLLPFEAVQRLARTVQLRLAATIGDSYLLLSSPLTTSTVLTKLDHDLTWLAKQCHRVVMLAHSQGAAVAYDAIERWAWTGRPQPKLTHLITYGSGLRKLFDLRAAEREPFRWAFFGVVTFGLSIVLLVLAAVLLSATSSLLAAFSLGGALGVAGLVLGALVVILLMGGLLLAASQLVDTNPALLDPVFDGPEWDDLYASHDPVPNGPVAVSGRTPEVWQELLRLANANAPPAIDRFYARQRQVTNRQSVLDDHTSYWECDDDFVARVATRLLGLARMPQDRLIQPWIALSAKRRRWRVRIRNNVRTVAAFMGLTAVLAPRVTSDTGAAIRTLFDGLSVPLFGLTTRNLPAVAPPESLFQILVMLGMVAIASLLADWGFKLWERGDRRQFFDKGLRADGQTPGGYTPAPVSKAAIGAGWLAVIASLPIAAALLGLERGDLRFDLVWPSVVASVASALILWSAGKPPGTDESWALQLLETGEERLRPTNADRESLETARHAFELSHSILERIHRKESERAARGAAEAQERLSRSQPGVS